MKADLNVHSKVSKHPSDWFLQRIGAGKSYTEPETIYRLAKSRGMDLVTITDHNRIDGILELMQLHPDDTFTGVETTAYFPEDGCKIHILLWNFTEKQFRKINKLRKNIYELRDYIKRKQLPHAVAHCNYSVNGKLKIEHLEKLILLFDNFESKNGTLGRTNNDSIYSVLSNLNPSHFYRLENKYQIKPFSDCPWEKGFTGGSDDYAGLFIGKTYTETGGHSREEFFSEILNKNSTSAGRNHHFTSLAFSIYKVAWDYSLSKNDQFAKKLISNVNELIYEPKELNLKNKLKIRGYDLVIGEDDTISRKIIDLIRKLEKSKEKDADKRIRIVYDEITDLIDKISVKMIKSIVEEMDNLNIIRIFEQIATLLPALFFATPFITALKHIYQDRELISQFIKGFEGRNSENNKRILWFTDTINDLNGVSESLKELSENFRKHGRQIMIATCLSEEDKKNSLPDNILELDHIYSFQAPFYESYKLKIPSILGSLKKISDYNPDEIYISTPGFIGLTGLLAAKLMFLPSTGIFHTDFARQLEDITEDEALINITDSYIRWFYNNTDFIASPTREYIKIIKGYGINERKIKYFKKWINTDLFYYTNGSGNHIFDKYDVRGRTILIYTGRVSKDKKIDIILEAFKKLEESENNLSLFIIGDGPYLSVLKEKYYGTNNIIFTGRIERSELPKYYSSADIFLFPSESDTFGMSVLEAQACGLPCIVSDKGGPQEIIKDGLTGKVVENNSIENWIKSIEEMILLIKDPTQLKSIKSESISNIKERYSFDLSSDNLIVEFQEYEK